MNEGKVKSRHELLTSALTVALNKVAVGSEYKIINRACEEIKLECAEDAHFVMRTFYHRAVHDNCFYKTYAQVLKALQEAYPDVLSIGCFPDGLASFERLLPSLEVREHKFFLDGVLDHRQRSKYVAAGVTRFLGHCFMQDIWDPRTMLIELLGTERLQLGAVTATCRKGHVLSHLLVPYVERRREEIELHVECACELLRLIGGAGIDVLDMTGRLKVLIVSQLAHWQCLQGPGEDPLLSKRIRFLVRNVLDQAWAKCCLEYSAAPSASAGSLVNERRIDPYDGRTYTLTDLLHIYRRKYTGHEIRRYFAFECKLSDARQQQQTRSRRSRRTTRPWAEDRRNRRR